MSAQKYRVEFTLEFVIVAREESKSAMHRAIDVISVPFSLGGKERGTAEGPRVLREHGLTRALCDAQFQVRERNLEFIATPGSMRGGVYNRQQVIDMAKRVGAEVFASLRLGHTPLVLGGDHSVSIGSLTQLLEKYISWSARVGLLWIDAHYDAHTSATTHSHYANGLPLSIALGVGDPRFGVFAKSGVAQRRYRLKFAPEHVLHIGAGDTDCETEELRLIRRLNVETVTMCAIQEHGTVHMLDALKRFLSRIDTLVVTLDLDAIRKDFAPGVSFRSSNGLLGVEAELIAEHVATSGKLRQLEIMEYNPEFEENNEHGAPRTATLVHGLVKKFLEI